MTDQSSLPVSAHAPNLDFTRGTETYVDGLSAAQVRNGIAKLNFFAVRRHDERDELVPALTVALSLLDLVSMTAALNRAVTQLQEQGLITVGAPQDAVQGDGEDRSSSIGEE